MGRSTTVKQTGWSWVSMITHLDPDWRSEGNNPTEYEFSNGRVFTGKEKSRGAYES